ncbi:RNA-directed DNA polymerase [Undibacterium sp. CY18W]|uniref:RNA-directed DNA polymerase n=1 Tax=Undibacterium hunanense TaxID=2762292 RepID=A0ABR6ZRU4_9BURK|nr:reverse transcriptase family protein [Undibacterium hunanense]MBC3918613.1 RNA-directed DNA polymerase [Undibacterium hunanense]
MDKPRQVALAIADALLAGEFSHVALMKNTTWVLGKKWPWIPSLCQKIEQYAGPHFYHYSRHEIAALILDDHGYYDAWRGKDKPQIKQYCLQPAIRPEKPAWLQDLALPDFSNQADLAKHLNLTVSELAWFADQWRPDAQTSPQLGHYHYRWLEKASGGWRLLEIPKSRLRNIQRKILQQILNRLPPHAAAQAFQQGRSSISHAALHTGQRVVVRLDLKDFFTSIPGSRLHALFAKLGYPDKVAGTLARLCSNRTPTSIVRDKAGGPLTSVSSSHLLRSPHLPQGAPTSPALANLCAYRLDIRLQTLAESIQACYSRYADDLTFSGDEAFEQSLTRFIPQVAAIVLEEGFVLNYKKTRIMRAATRQQVTGIVVNRHCNIKRSDYDTLKATLTNCLRSNPASQNRAGHADFRTHLAGKLAYMRMINPARTAKLQTLFNQINWSDSTTMV